MYIANCILDNLKFKVRIVLFKLLNSNAQYISNFVAVCRSPVASRFSFSTIFHNQEIRSEAARKPASALEDIEL